jgi:hypothetical protein
MVITVGERSVREQRLFLVSTLLASSTINIESSLISLTPTSHLPQAIVKIRKTLSTLFTTFRSL